MTAVEPLVEGLPHAAEMGWEPWWALALGFTIAGAVVTFVCSVRDLPFAVIRWSNGIAFGGVMSFIFPDLILPTIDDASHRYCGLRMAAVLFVSIFATAVVSGVVIHSLWAALGLIPTAGEAGGTAPGGYTTYLHAAFTVRFLGQVSVARVHDGDEESAGAADHHAG